MIGLVLIAQNFLLKNVNVFTPKGKIDSVDILVENGIIKKIGKNLNSEYKIINGNYYDVYPSFINAISSVGLVEISAVRATNDLSEIGDFNAFLKSYNAVNPSSAHIGVIRSNGVLIVNTIPRGSLISGFSSVIKLNGRTQEEMLIKGKSALNIFWNMKKIKKNI
jgi:imidazolonepropionase-like amidohydrolase